MVKHFTAASVVYTAVQ